MRPGVLQRWFRFQAIGAAGILVQIASLYALREWCGMSVGVATALAVEFSILHNFCWHRHWTWAIREDGLLRRKPVLRQLCEYNLTYSLISLVTNVALTQAYIRTFHAHYIVANLMAIATVGIANFLTGELVIFRPMARKEPETNS